MGGAETPQPDTRHIDSGKPAALDRGEPAALDRGDELSPEKPKHEPKGDEAAVMLQDKQIRAKGAAEVQRGFLALSA